MPTSSSGAMTMMARGLRPTPTPTRGAVHYPRPTPPIRKSKHPPPQRCPADSRCSVNNLVPIGSNYSTWEDPQLTDDPRRLQKLAYGLLHGDVDHTMLHDYPFYYRVDDERRRRSEPCPAPGHRQRAWQSTVPMNGRRQAWMSSEAHGLTRTCSAPCQAAVTTPWVPQQVWQPRRNTPRQVTDRQITAAFARHQNPIELVASKAKIFRRPQSAYRVQSDSFSDDRRRPQSSRPATRSCTEIRQRPASAVPVSHLAPRQLFCPDCVAHYCDAPYDEPTKDHSCADSCDRSHEDCCATLSCNGYGSKSHGQFDLDPFCDCAGYGKTSIGHFWKAPSCIDHSRKPYGQTNRSIYYPQTVIGPCEDLDPDLFGPIESYCDGDLTPGFVL